MAESMLALEREAVIRQQNVADMIASGASSVGKFYSGSNVFVTGGSGFIGKQLLEKLFRCCNVNKVYLLLRAKKGKPAQQRVKQILQDPVFDSLHKQKPTFPDSILAVSGDVSELRLGLSSSDWDLVTEQVNIIFHTAATVNFNESMKVVAFTNVRGTREVLRLAKCCKELSSIVHVSTAYSHATKGRVGQAVKEQFYDSPVPPNAFIDMAENIDENKLENMMQFVKEDWPNSYSFSKALGEELVRCEAGNLPITIVRPSIVISSYREPLPGWIDPMNSLGASGLILGLSTGIIHVLKSRQENVLSLVPSDLVINTMLVAGWETTKMQSKEENIKIYNVTNNRNSNMWSEIEELLDTFGRKMISSRAVWYCFSVQTTNKILYTLLFWLLHFIPSFIADTACRFTNRRPMTGPKDAYVELTVLQDGHPTSGPMSVMDIELLNIYQKVYKLSSALEYFILNDWKFHDNNTLQLHKSMSSIDREVFNCDMGNLDRKEYLKVWFYGVRKYIIKEADFKNQEETDRKQFWLKIATYFIFGLYIYFFYVMISYVYSKIIQFV